jgi:hypothetical protein
MAVAEYDVRIAKCDEGHVYTVRIGREQAKSVECTALKSRGVRSAPGLARSPSLPMHFDFLSQNHSRI